MNHQIFIDKLNQWCLASQIYYEGDEPIMSDSEFDKLDSELKNCGFPDIINFVNKNIYRNGEFQFEHYEQELISLFKIKFNVNNRFTAVNQILSFLSNSPEKSQYIYGAPKFDGCSLKITWKISEDKNFEIESIITRGGIDVTNILKNHQDIVNTRFFGEKIICGELVIAKQKFIEKYGIDGTNELGLNYANPRNFVAGMLKRNDLPKEVINDLTFVPCTNGIDPLENAVYVSVDGKTKNVWDKFSNTTQLANYINNFCDFKSDKFPFLCDGIVFGYITKTYKRIVKDNYPLNMVALKFPAVRAKTEVIDIEWSQKKIGKLTPKLKLKPTNLDGSIIQYANGYNIENLELNKIGIGSIVEIEKSGDIIPVVVNVLVKSDKIRYPDIECKREGKFLVTYNVLESKIFKFVSAFKSLQIQGIGDKSAELIGSVLDYDILKCFDSSNIPKISAVLTPGTFQKFKEIYNIKRIRFDHLIYMLQFDGVGPKIAEKCALLLLRMSKDNSGLPSFVFTDVLRGEGFKKIIGARDFLGNLGIYVIKPIETNPDTITYEMSGNPPGMSKSDFEKKMLEKYPNSVHVSLTKQTQYLVVDSLNSNTSKVLKARKYNIKIKTYEDMLSGQLDA